MAFERIKNLRNDHSRWGSFTFATLIVIPSIILITALFLGTVSLGVWLIATHPYALVAIMVMVIAVIIVNAVVYFHVERIPERIREIERKADEEYDPQTYPREF